MRWSGISTGRDGNVNGELENVGGGKWRLRFTRSLTHSPEAVWRAITELDELKAWFPDGIKGDFTVGSTLTFGSRQVGEFTGEVLSVDPPKSLEYTWGTDVLRFEIEPTDTGCVLTLLDTIDEVGKAARDGAGWHVCLDKLELFLDGDEPAWSDGEHWKELYASYVETFGPEAATIGPPGT
jgi:uncharacterized protein YndB with AHSA1/START domain